MSHVVSLSVLDKNKNWVSPSMKKNRMCNGICFQVLVKECRSHKNKCEHFTFHQKQKRLYHLRISIILWTLTVARNYKCQNRSCQKDLQSKFCISIRFLVLLLVHILGR
ncbi:hypothetical protein NC652_037072 [Populus alba x Populus x berolinensis]|nr:hypothetical protein NC652_037072 [Populus alba x Populus x berolinensis]